MKFIGHLDMMRYFQKAMRRAQIDIAFTEGFSPHMIMSFALPLGVGLTSDAEYMDIEIRTPVSSKEAVRRLNQVMADGVNVFSFRQIEEGKASNAMTLVSAAAYNISFHEGKEPPDGWTAHLAEFLAQKQIIVTKKTKNGEREEDIRPLIYSLEQDRRGVSMTVAAGSAANLKPELVMEAFAAMIGWNIPEFALLINRKELYATIGGSLVALEELGKDIGS